MKRLKVTHYLQDPAHCAVAACSAVGNFYNDDIDYEYAKKIRIINNPAGLPQTQ